LVLDQTVGDNRDGSLRPIRTDEIPEGVLYGAVDLGTNNCRLLTATPLDDGFRVVEAFSRITRLGEGLATSGALSEEAMSRTLCALKQCAQRLERRGVARVRSVATEACRRAANCVDFIDRVQDETGLNLEIISTDDEARLALAGCAPLLDRRHPYALVFDIGGGSTELIKVKLCEDGTEEVQAVASLPLGVVTIAEHRGSSIHHPEGYRAAVDAMTDLLRPFHLQGDFDRLVAAGQMQMLGTSGTVTTLAGVHLDLARYDRTLVDGFVMDFAAVEDVSRSLVGATLAERAAHPCIGEDRADLVVAGCAILEAICLLWPVGWLRVADRGVREGVLLSMMRADKVAVAE
jgi:exopolyphosphatase/guanosine-5'-triphosphate,3'-diphosphate pyrophosphatase